MNNKLFLGISELDVIDVAHCVVRTETKYGELTYDTKTNEVKLNDSYELPEGFDTKDFYENVIRILATYVSLYILD